MEMGKDKALALTIGKEYLVVNRFDGDRMRCVYQGVTIALGVVRFVFQIGEVSFEVYAEGDFLIELYEPIDISQFAHSSQDRASMFEIGATGEGLTNFDA